jgi:hypothetical protein
VKIGGRFHFCISCAASVEIIWIVIGNFFFPDRLWGKNSQPAWLNQLSREIFLITNHPRKLLPDLFIDCTKLR